MTTKTKTKSKKTKKSSLQQFTFNLKGAEVRHDTMEGREYLVVPMVMMTEGVHNGSNGPLYYPADELNKTPQVWNHKPIVVYHPEINGQGVSACDPQILTSQKVGVIMNTVWDGKLKAEAWIDKERVDLVDDRISAAIENKQMMEVSTGLFTDNEIVSGEWNGEEYDYIARNYRPDHLALLPDKIGACSIADGAGFLRLNEEAVGNQKIAMLVDMIYNELSHDNIRRQIHGELDTSVPKTNKYVYRYVEDVFSDFFIFNEEGKLFKMNYSVTNNKVTVSGESKEVVRVTEYRTVGGTFVGNSTTKPSSKESDMDKKKFVDAMIANTESGWDESDREYLMGKDESALKRLAGVKPVDPEAEAVANAAKKGASEAAPTNNAAPAAPKKMTMDEYIANAPDGIREVLSQGVTSLAAQKAAAIEKITKSPANVFSKEFLATKQLDELQGLAAMAVATLPAPESQNGVQMFIQPNYAGQSIPVDNAQHGETELPLPSMEFSAN